MIANVQKGGNMLGLVRCEVEGVTANSPGGRSPFEYESSL